MNRPDGRLTVTAMTSDLRDIDSGKAPEETGRKSLYEQSWAVVIGINDYERYSKLRFAVADAAGMAEMLIARFDFPPDRVFLVLDSPDVVSERAAAWLAGIRGKLAGFETRATKAIIEQLLFTTLPERTGSDDRVVVYFAGHGTPRRVPGASASDAAPYLIPVDGTPSRWDTYIDLNAVIRQSEYIAAKHVLYVLDACCAGLAGIRADEQPSHFKRDLLQRKARQCITAATAEGYAADRGYDGHSLFTWHVLQALGGAVKLGVDGMICTSSLTAYIKEAVGRDPSSQQTPNGFTLGGHEGGEFVFSALQAPLTLDERAVLARLLVDEVGRRLDEPAPLELAAKLWGSIADAAPDAAQASVGQRERARALVLLGRPAEARLLLDDPRLADDADAMLLRGLSGLKLGAASTADDLARFATAHPDHPYATWAGCAAQTITQRRRHALLVGVGVHPNYRTAGGGTISLRGCWNDVEAMRDVLQNQLGFQVETLRDDEATAEAIRAALREAASASEPDDTFVCYLSGNGALASDPEQFIFVTHDSNSELSIGLTEAEIDAAMRAIPARDKLLITDACHLAPAEDQLLPYRFLSGGRRDQMTFEIALEASSAAAAEGHKQHRGAFTYALERALRVMGNVSMRSLWPKITEEISLRRLSQNPAYLGDPDRPFVRNDNPALEIIDLAEHRTAGRFSLPQLLGFADWLPTSGRAGGAMVPLSLGVGRALLSRKSYARAAEVLESIEHQDAQLSLVKAQLLSDRYAEAQRSWAAFRDARQSSEVGAAASTEVDQRLHEVLGALGDRAGHALLVGVHAGTSAEWTSDLEPMLTRVQRVLVERCRMKANVRIALDPSRDLLLELLRGIAAKPDHPPFFLFVGPGCDDPELWLSSASSPARLADISPTELRDCTAACTNLTSAIFITKTCQPASDTLGPSLDLPVGLTTLIAAPQRARDLGRPLLPPPPDIPHLIEVLERHAHESLSAEEWRAHAARSIEINVRGDGRASLFSDVGLRREAFSLLRSLEQAPLRRILPLLSRLAEQREFAAEAHLHTGIVHGALGLHDKALADLDTAEARRHANPTAQAAPAETPPPWAEAHYHRGRILLEAGRSSKAEAELTLAVQHATNHARAHYYRAQAIRRLIEADLEHQVSASLQRYLALEAPLGLDDDLLQFVARRDRMR